MMVEVGSGLLSPYEYLCGARALFAEHGGATGVFLDAADRVCMMGAVYQEVYGDPRGAAVAVDAGVLIHEQMLDRYPICYTIISTMEGCLPRRGPGNITAFNDHGARDNAERLAVFDCAIAKLAEQEGVSE